MQEAEKEGHIVFGLEMELTRGGVTSTAVPSCPQSNSVPHVEVSLSALLRSKHSGRDGSAHTCSPVRRVGYGAAPSICHGATLDTTGGTTARFHDGDTKYSAIGTARFHNIGGNGVGMVP